MNKRHNLSGIKTQHPDFSSLMILSSCFLVGVCAGCILAAFFQQGSDPHLFSYLDEYFSVMEKGGKNEINFFSTVWEFIRWPLLAGLMGATLFGVIALPVLLCLRGFLLSYAISILISLYGGWYGLLLALCIFSAPAFTSVAILFLIGRIVLCRHIHGQSGTQKGNVGRLQMQKILVMSLVWIAVGIFLQHWICPALLRGLAGIL